MGPSSASDSIGRKTTPTGRKPWLTRGGAALGLLVVVILGAAMATRLIDMRYLNVPVVHPWPPQGYSANPFNPSDRSDVIPSDEAARVRSDLLADGRIELTAASAGDPGSLPHAETGRALASILQLLHEDASKGVYETSTHRLDSVVTGRLQDPNDPAIRWCVQERGQATLSFIRRDTGAVTSTRTFRFQGRFWMVKVGERYLIADTQIVEQ